MTYHDYYQSVPTEADMPEIPAGAVVDVIGQWFEYDEVTETNTAREGWHFNVRSNEPIEFAENVTQHNPYTPWRVWA